MRYAGAAPERWWQYAEKRDQQLCSAIADLDRVLVIARAQPYWTCLIRYARPGFE